MRRPVYIGLIDRALRMGDGTRVPDRSPKSKLSDTQMLELWEQGVAVKAIADGAGLDIGWTYRRLKRAGADVGPTPRPCPIPTEQLAAEYRAGASILVLARRHGLYYKRVRNLLLAFGVELRPSTKPAPDVGPKPVPPNPGPIFRQLYVESNLTLQEIMAEYAIGYRKLRKFLSGEGVTFRAPHPRTTKLLPATRSMVRDYAGMSLKAVAAKHHLPTAELRERLTLAGVEIRQRGRPTLEKNKRVEPPPRPPRQRTYPRDPWHQKPPNPSTLTSEIVTMFEADMPLGEIARHAGLSEQAVTARLAREGLGPGA